MKRVAQLSLAALVVVGTARPAQADSYDDVSKPDAPEDVGNKPKPGEEADKPLDAGGLTAPGDMGETGEGRSQIEKDLEEADRADAGRGLEFAWLNGELGFQHIDVRALGGDFAGGPVPSSASGVVYGAGLGVRALYFTLGGRFRYGSLSGFDTWSLVGEGSFRLPLGHFEPYATLGFGYTALSGLQVPNGASTIGLSAEGLVLRAAVGTDYYFSDTFSVGAQVSGDVLFLSRDAVAGPVQGDPSLTEPGSSVGLGVVPSVLVGLHF